MMNGPMMIGMGLAAALVVAVLLAVLVLAVLGSVWLVRRLRSGPQPADAREVLRRRYAAGELDEVEFERRMAVLDR